jgi:putative copper export protein
MLSPTAATIRLFVHVIAATVWVGGQFALAGVVGPLRRASPDAVKIAANAFARIAWPAYGVLVVTGIWNLMAVDITSTSNAYQATVLVKILLAILAGVFTGIHAVGRTKLALAMGGALGALCSLGALYLGVLLHSGTG